MRSLLGLLLLLTTACAPTVSDSLSGDVAFTNVSVIPMTADTLLTNQTVVVSDGRIAAVGPSVAIPEGAMRIDGTGQYLVPGLAEMHGHIPPPTRPEEEIENTLFLYLANGITTVRGMLGWEGQLDLRDRVAAGELDSPTLYLAGPSFSGGSVSSPEQSEARVRSQAAEGWDLLKIHPGLSLAEYDAMAETAAELGIRFGGHVPDDVGLLHALDMGQETFDHIDGYVAYLASVDPDGIDGEALADVVERTIDAEAWVVPTMVLWETILGLPELDELSAFPELQYMPEGTVASWENAWHQRRDNPGFDMAGVRAHVQARMEVLRALNDAGAGILMGTDAPQQYSVPGFSLHRETVRMIEAGMTPFEVLRSGTRNVGAYFADQDRFGTIEPGMRADLILLGSNPLDDAKALRDRRGVMARGTWYPEAVIQERLAAIAASYR